MLLSVGMVVVSGWITSYAQEIESEVPGDHFSLEGALELFKKSESPEEFERLLNSADSQVNNLDLNDDGYIDYIRVFDRYEGNVHAFIIQAVVSEKENQDIAVIELEKLANGKAVLQIIGDEDVYGIETIIEPTREVRTYAGSTSTTTVVNVWAWPSVQYVYGPYYSGWYSPWGWHRRPMWWRSWRPVAYVHYYPRWHHYRPFYSVCHTHRVVYAHEIYRPYRTTSMVYHNRHHAQISRYRSAPRDDHRNGRTRGDERRYSDNDRSSSNGRQRSEISDLNRRSSDQRERTTSTDRMRTTERSERTDMQRNLTETKREDSGDSRDFTYRNSSESRQQALRPTENRNRLLETPKVQQGSTSTERSVPTEIRRNSTASNRNDFQYRKSRTVGPYNDSRQQVIRPTQHRNRLLESPTVQRSTSREQTVQTDIQRNSSRQNRGDFSNTRSGTVHKNFDTHQQVRPATTGRDRSSGGSSMQQRSLDQTGGTRSGETRRGRH